MIKKKTLNNKNIQICNFSKKSGSRLTFLSRVYVFCYVQKLEQGDENCEGVGEEECFLIRRTLVAHTDYIYTQNHNP